MQATVLDLVGAGADDLNKEELVINPALVGLRVQSGR